MADDINGYAVAGQVVRLVVIWWQVIVVVQSHQSCRLSRRNQTRSNLLAFDDEDHLAAGTPPGVRRHPATSSKRTSARWTLTPFSLSRVRL